MTNGTEFWRIWLKKPAPESDTKIMDSHGMHDSPVHRQPVRIIKKPAQGIYIPSDQQIKKRILPEFLRRGKKARVTTIPDMMVSFGDAAAAEPKVQKARIGSRLRPFLPKVPRGIFYSGLSLLLCIFCVLVLSSGAQIGRAHV